jgi:hypothetical protein
MFYTYSPPNRLMALRILVESINYSSLNYISLSIILLFSHLLGLPNVAVKWLVLLIHFWEVPSSNRGTVTGYVY